MKHHRSDLSTGGRPAGAAKMPTPGVKPGTGDVSSQENPRRQRRQDYTPQPQPRESGVKIS